MLSDYEKNKRKNTKRERNQRIVDLYTSGRGLTMKEVGQMCGGISKQAVSVILKRYGVEPEYVRKRRLAKKRITLTCRTCEKNFKVPPWQKDKRVHCSKKCRVKYTDDDLRAELLYILEEHGKITSTLIKKEATPAYSTFRYRIGNLDKMKKFALRDEALMEERL